MNQDEFDKFVDFAENFYKKHKTIENNKERISFSAIKTFDTCSKKYQIAYKKRIPAFHSNEYTIFGNTVHNGLEYTLNTKKIRIFEDDFLKELTNFASEKFFLELYEKNKQEEWKSELDTFLLEFYSKHFAQKLIHAMFNQGQYFYDMILAFLEKEFGDFEVLHTEEDLFELIDEFDDKIFKNEWYFKGFVDLVIKDAWGNIHLIDYKTTTWGWDAERKNDTLTGYQLTLYKHYYAKKYNIHPSKIKTYFILLKRTANKKRLEILRITSGKKKTQNSLKKMKEVMYAHEQGLFLKNRRTCKFCPFNETEWCSGRKTQLG